MTTIRLEAHLLYRRWLVSLDARYPEESPHETLEEARALRVELLDEEAAHPGTWTEKQLADFRFELAELDRLIAA